MEEAIRAEFECACARAREAMRLNCMSCDLCFYYNFLDTNNIADSNPWSIKTSGPHEKGNRDPAFAVPIPLRPVSSSLLDPDEETVPDDASQYAPDDTFDDSLILPASAYPSYQSKNSITRSRSDRAFTLGLIEFLSDPLCTSGPYELNRKPSRKSHSPSHSVSRPHRRFPSDISSRLSYSVHSDGSSLDDRDQDSIATPTTPDLEPSFSLNRTSTDVSDDAFSDEDDGNFFPKRPILAIRQNSLLEEVPDFPELLIDSLEQQEMEAGIPSFKRRNSINFAALAKAMPSLKIPLEKRRSIFAKTSPTLVL